MENMEKIYTKNGVKQKMVRNSGFLSLYWSLGGRGRAGRRFLEKKKKIKQDSSQSDDVLVTIMD